MTCTEYRQELEQSFGQTLTEADTIQHLNSCAECREYWEQLASLAQELPDDSQFHSDDATIDALVQRVEDAIQPSVDIAPITQQESDKVSTWTWMRLLPAAAAVLIVVGVGIGGYLLGRNDINQTTGIDDQSVAMPLGSIDDIDYDEPDGPTFEVLLSDFAADRPFDASEKLLNDITNEEMEYLTRNFDVGDLL